MKKTIGKTVLIVCICALLIFLLLPFLETQTPENAAGKKASPQIFTSNPLTSLVNRIAALFQSKEKRLAKQAALAKAEAQAAKDALNELYADVPPQTAARYAAANAEGETQTTTFNNSNFDYGNAALQDEQGNWVLVRQTAPDAPARGMHEINTTDDAYERYVRQEKAARYTPGIDAPSRPADSALARLLTPIKNLLGMNPSNASSVTAERAPSARPVSSSQGLGSNAGKEPSQQTGKQSPNMPDFTLAALPSASGRGPAGAGMAFGGSSYSGGELLNPMLAITRASDWIANNQDADATDEEKQQNTEKLKNFIKKSREELSNQLTQQVQEAAGDAPAPDRLPSTIGCKGESGSFYAENNAPCSNIPSMAEDSSAWMSADEQEKQNALGKKQLLEKLNLPANHPAIPDVNMLVVLGKTKNILPPDMQNHEGDTQEQKQAKEVIARIYEMMLDKQNCSKEECYWIPNKLQQYPSVRETVLSAGFNSVEDPLNLYNKWVPELEKEMMEETKDDESGQRFLDVQKALSQNAPAYIPVTRAQMEELNRRNDDRKLMDPKTRKDHIVFYVPDPQNARDMMDVFHEHPAFMLWGKDGKVFDRDADLNTADRANILQDDVTQRAQEMATFAKGVVQEMYQENLKDSSRRQTRKISNMNAKQATQELQKKLPDNKKSSGGKGLSGKTPALQFKELKL